MNTRKINFRSDSSPKKNIFRISISLLFLLNIISCTKEFIINTNSESDQIVINALFSNLDTFSVSVTKSFSPSGDFHINELETATVSIFENGDFIEDMVYSKSPSDVIGKFTSSFVPSINKEYEIRVSDTELGEASAKSSIPDAVELSNFSANITAWGDGGVNPVERYKYSFTTRDPSENSFYFLSIYMLVYNKDIGIDPNHIIDRLYAEVHSSDLPDQIEYVNGGLLFTDEVFNGTEYTISGTATIWDSSAVYFATDELEKDQVLVDASNLYINLEVLSKETYNFYRTHSEILKAQYNYYAEPTQVYGNVEQGLGIFGGLYRKTVRIELYD